MATLAASTSTCVRATMRTTTCRASRSGFAGRQLLVQAAKPAVMGRSAKFVVRAKEDKLEPEEIIKTLSEKWEGVENKSEVAIIAGASLVFIWFSSAVVSAVDSIPLLPKLMELVGLGYTAWFTYRYLIFKNSRKELAEDIEELKSKIAGATIGEE